MTARVFANAGAQSTCTSPITAAQTTVTLVSATGFGTIPTGKVLDVVILDAGAPGFNPDNPFATNYEYQPVSSIAGNVLTFGGGVRAAYAGTTPKAYSAGAIVAAVTLAEALGTFPIKIGEAVLTGLATIFPAIAVPGGFRSLLIAGNFQGNGATVDLGLQFNGDTAASYAYMQIYNLGAGPAGGASTVTTSALVGQAPSGSSASFTAYIGNHGLTSLTNHPVISMCTGAGIALLRGSYWNNGGAAITSIVAVSTGNCITDSMIEVFGLP